MITNLSAAD